MKSSVLWDMTPCSLLEVNQSFRGTCYLHLQGCRVSQARNQHETGSKQLAYSSPLEMEATCSSKISVDFQQTTQCYIPEDRTLHMKLQLKIM
jgi:hypothetical protein